MLLGGMAVGAPGGARGVAAQPDLKLIRNPLTLVFERLYTAD